MDIIRVKFMVVGYEILEFVFYDMVMVVEIIYKMWEVDGGYEF